MLTTSHTGRNSLFAELMKLSGASRACLASPFQMQHRAVGQRLRSSLTASYLVGPASLHRGIPPAATRAHERWSMDFVHDALFDGRSFRVLTVVDQWSRWIQLLEVAHGMSGKAVAEALNRAIERHAKPRSITRRSAPRGCSTTGPINALCYSTSSDPASPWKTAGRVTTENQMRCC